MESLFGKVAFSENFQEDFLIEHSRVLRISILLMSNKFWRRGLNITDVDQVLKKGPILGILIDVQCVKSVSIQNFSDQYFPAFELNTDQKNFEYGQFSRSDNVSFPFSLWCMDHFNIGLCNPWRDYIS